MKSARWARAWSQGLAVLLTGWLSAGVAAQGTGPWDQHAVDSGISIDHSSWESLLGRYLITDHPSGINRFRYGDVTSADRDALSRYVAMLAALDPRTLDRGEQQAYWINLYNAVTVGLVVDAYPVESIRRISGGLLRTGPWDEPVVEVLGRELSLNAVEHDILRPVYRDPRIHYAINCASLGCPNLAPRPYAGTTLDADLDAAAREFLAHPRALQFAADELRLSSIYQWFAEDFGSGRAGLLAHLQRFAPAEARSRLGNYTGRIRYAYDWALNDP